MKQTDLIDNASALAEQRLTLPLADISLRVGKPEAYRQAIFDGIYRAMREALNVPEDDQFMTISQHDEANFRYGNAYGVVRSADTVYTQIIVFSARTVNRRKRCSGGSRSC